VLRAYLQSTAAGPEGRAALAAHRKPGLMPIIQDVRIFDGEGEETDHVYAGSPMALEIHYDSPVVLEHPVFGVFAESMVGERLFHLQTISQHPLIERLPQRGVARCAIPMLPLQPDSYYLSFNCSTLHSPGNLDWLERVRSLHVEEADVFGTGRLPPRGNGPFLVKAQWSFPEAGEPPRNGAVAAGEGSFSNGMGGI
jgi:hypothetical protein